MKPTTKTHGTDGAGLYSFLVSECLDESKPVQSRLPREELSQWALSEAGDETVTEARAEALLDDAAAKFDIETRQDWMQAARQFRSEHLEALEGPACRRDRRPWCRFRVPR